MEKLLALLAAHWISVAPGLDMLDHEVSTAEYALFASATSHVTTAERLGSSLCFTGNMQALWATCDGVSWRDLDPVHPVTHLSISDVEAFAAWIGARLPTAAEWDAAAGTAKPCNIWRGDFPERPAGHVGSIPSHSCQPNDLGLYGMRGNVWELTSTGISGWRVIRGGSYLCSDQWCSGFRVGAYQTATDEAEHIGFRLVRDVTRGT